MAITNGLTGDASDFVSTSAGAGDSGKVPTLNSSGKLDPSFFTVETSTATTYSLTTTAGQTVIVWVKGDYINNTGTAPTGSIVLNYNSVQKDSLTIKASASTERVPFALMYTETPGAATHDITVVGTSYTVANVVIIILKIG